MVIGVTAYGDVLAFKFNVGEATGSILGQTVY